MYFRIVEKIPTIYIRERREYLFLGLYLAGPRPYPTLRDLQAQEQCGMGDSLRRISWAPSSRSHLKCHLPERPSEHTPWLKEAPPMFSLPLSPHFIVFIALTYVCSDLPAHLLLGDYSSSPPESRLHESRNPACLVPSDFPSGEETQVRSWFI